jgi:hypothetical protein
LGVTDEASSVFHGVVGSVDFQWMRPTREWVSFGYTHEVYPSLVTSDSPYYISTQYRVLATTGTSATLSLGLVGYYFVNDFPTDTSTRTDRIWSGEVWAGYRYRGWLEWRVYVNMSSRASNEPGFDYKGTRVGTLLRMGS